MTPSARRFGSGLRRRTNRAANCRELGGRTPHPVVEELPRLDHRWALAARAAILLAIAAMTAHAAFSGPMKHPVDSTGRFNDHSINESLSVWIDENRDYPGGFTYPPPMAIVRLWLFEWLGNASGWVWAAAAVVAVWGCIGLGASLAGVGSASIRALVSLAGLIATWHYVQYDLRSLNSNSMALAATLAGIAAIRRNRSVLGGGCLAAAIAIKLYAVVFLPVLMLRRDGRSLVWTCVWLGIFFVAMPLARWGLQDAARISGAWIREARATSNPEFTDRFIADLVSIQRTARAVTQTSSPEAGDGKAFCRFLAAATTAAWLALLAAYFGFAARLPPFDDASRFADECMLLLAPLPLSPLLQPHHFTPLLVCSILLATQAASTCRRNAATHPSTSAAPFADRGMFARLVCVIALAGGMLVIEFGPSGPLRGIAMGIHLLLTVAGLTAIRFTAAIPRRDIVHPFGTTSKDGPKATTFDESLFRRSASSPAAT